MENKQQLTGNNTTNESIPLDVASAVRSDSNSLSEAWSKQEDNKVTDSAADNVEVAMASEVTPPSALRETVSNEQAKEPVSAEESPIKDSSNEPVVENNTTSEVTPQSALGEAVLNESIKEPVSAEESLIKDSSNEPVVENNMASEATLQSALGEDALNEPTKEEIKPEKKVLPEFKMPEYLPNASQNQWYGYRCSSDITGAHANREIEDLGLAWNNETKCYEGIPKISGEFEIIWQSALPNQTKTSTIYINADPASLWKNIPSDKNARFYKEDNANMCLETEEAWLIGARVRGRSHAHVGSCCDDDFIIHYFEDRKIYLLAVSDGAGSSEFSRYASKLVVNAVKNTIDSMLKGKDGVLDNESLPKLVAQSAYDAYMAIYNTVDKEKLSLKQLYCTLSFTLVGFINNQWMVSSYSVGDGVIAKYSQQDNRLTIINQLDSGMHAGETQFLSDKFVEPSEIKRRIGKTYSLINLPLLFLMTDGVSDPKFESEEQLNNSEKWQVLWQELYQDVLEKEDKAAALEKWLNFFSKGNHDDRTLVMLVPKHLLTHNKENKV